MYAKKEKIYPTYVSKIKSWKDFLIIPKGEEHKRSETLATQATPATSEERKDRSEVRRRWHSLVEKKLSALLRGITSKHQGDFYCLNCFHFFRKEKETWIA